MRKTQIIILIVITLITSCKAISQTNQKEMDLVVYNKGSYTLAECDSSYFYLMEAQIINNSNTLKDFVAYNCLTCFNFLTDNNKVNIYGNHCASNSLSTFRLEPHNKLSIPLILQVKQNISINIDSIKIGFVFLNPKNFKDEKFRDVITDMKISKQNILWSKSVSFQLCIDEQYVITNAK